MYTSEYVILAKILKYLCQNLFITAITQTRSVYKDHEILVTLKRCITLLFKFLDSQHKISSFRIVVLIKTFFVYLVTMQIRPLATVQIRLRLLIWKWTVKNWASFCTSCKYRMYLNTWDYLNKLILHFYIIFISIIILLSL